MTWSAFISRHFLEVAVALPLLLLCSAFFSATETALFNLSRAQLARFGGGGRGGRRVARLMKRPRRLLNAVLLGNMLANVAYSAIAAVTVLDLAGVGLSPVLAAVMSLVPLLMLILIGEVGAKTLAFALGEKLAVLAAVPLALIMKVLSPPLWLLERVFVHPLTLILAPKSAAEKLMTADELSDLLEISARRGVLNLEASELLQEIVTLTDIRAGDIMVPRVDIMAVEVGASAAEVAAMFRRTRLRRLPVYEKDIDHVLGVVHAKRFLLSPGTPLGELVVKVPFVPEAANVERALIQFRVTRTQLAIVVDEYGGTAGLITLEDVLEQIVGDIPDPHSPQRHLVDRVSQREYLVDGDLTMHEWSDAFRVDISGHRISTIGGFVTSLLGRIPRVGDTVVHRNLRLTVVSMRKRRIEKLRLELLDAQRQAAPRRPGGKRP